MNSCMTHCGSEEESKIWNHPCYSEKAHHFFARIHLPVAPACNIQCNYCNHKFDCVNESRPGVTSEQLNPEEALIKLSHIASKVKELSVVGIAGPGDALANPERSFETMKLTQEYFPDLQLCLSTNGLMLPQYVNQIVESGVNHVTVTLNTFQPETAAKIYSWVLYEGQKDSSPEAMRWFLQQQQIGIRTLVNLGLLVKVNSLMIPGINDQELPIIAKKIRLLGVFMHNIMPLIAKPEHGTWFGKQNWPEPTDQELETMREKCGTLKQMAHCRQCRADAIGRLGDDRFESFTKEKLKQLPLPTDNGSVLRTRWKKRINTHLKNKDERVIIPGNYTIAACSKDMGVVNQHFGHAKEFLIYQVINGTAKLINVRKVEDHYCQGADSCDEPEDRFNKIFQVIQDCDAVVCLRVGYPVHKKLEAHGILPVTETPGFPVEKAVMKAAEHLYEIQKSGNSHSLPQNNLYQGIQRESNSA